MLSKLSVLLQNREQGNPYDFIMYFIHLFIFPPCYRVDPGQCSSPELSPHHEKDRLSELSALVRKGERGGLFVDKMPPGIQRAIHDENLQFLRYRGIYTNEYFTFIRSLASCNIVSKVKNSMGVTCTPQWYHMHITWASFAHHMGIICTPHEHHIHTTWVSHAPLMGVTCTTQVSLAHHMGITCTLYVCHRHSTWVSQGYFMMRIYNSWDIGESILMSTAPLWGH